VTAVESQPAFVVSPHGAEVGVGASAEVLVRGGGPSMPRPPHAPVARASGGRTFVAGMLGETATWVQTAAPGGKKTWGGERGQGGSLKGKTLGEEGEEGPVVFAREEHGQAASSCASAPVLALGSASAPGSRRRFAGGAWAAGSGASGKGGEGGGGGRGEGDLAVVALSSPGSPPQTHTRQLLWDQQNQQQRQPMRTPANPSSELQNPVGKSFKGRRKFAGGTWSSGGSTEHQSLSSSARLLG
ncbi:unnamed protein product, partial [Discosporangium mesarthrocarpum]